MFYACNPKDGKTANSKSTANGYGHWFNASGAVCAYANGYLYSEMNPSSLTFHIGQYPGRVKQGSDYIIGQALRYKPSADKEATARFVFRVHITNTSYGAELVGIDYDNPSLGVEAVPAKGCKSKAIFNLQGLRLSNPQSGSSNVDDRQMRYMQRGLNIVHETLVDGTTRSLKVISHR